MDYFRSQTLAMSQIENIIKSLRAPTTPTLSPSQLVQSSIYLLPTLKNPLNISLLTTEIIFSPTLFPDIANQNVDLDLAVMLMEGFKAAADRKALITDPTVSPLDWILSIYKSVENLAPAEQWRALPVLGGIILAITKSSPETGKNIGGSLALSGYKVKMVEQLFVDFIHNTVHAHHKSKPQAGQLAAAVVILSVVLPHLGDGYKKQLGAHLILPAAVELVYTSEKGLDLPKVFRSLIIDSKSTSLNDKLNKNPVFRHLNSLSLLIQFLIHNSHPIQEVEVVFEALKHIVQFSELLASEYQNLAAVIGADAAETNNGLWRFIKFSLFSLSVSFQGYTSWLLLHINRKLFQKYAVPAATSIIKAFSNVYFVVAQISLSGFPTFDFVYYSCLDILLDPAFAQVGISEVVAELSVPFLKSKKDSLAYIESDLVNRGRLIYLLNLDEHLVPLLPFSEEVSSKKKTPTISNSVLPLVTQLLTPPESESNITITYFQPVLESAHSVFLAIVSTPSQILERNNGSRDGDVSSDIQDKSAETSSTNTQKYLDHKIPEYLQTVLSLFPGVLSPNQFTLAITTVVRACSPPSPLYRVNMNRSEWILNQIHDKAQNDIQPGVPLPAELGTHAQNLNDNGQSNSDDKNIPVPTTRAVVISSLIHSLPYVHITLLETWLNKVVKLIQRPDNFDKTKIGPAYKLEQEYLETDLFQMISEELEQYKSTIGIKWWYKAKL